MVIHGTIKSIAIVFLLILLVMGCISNHGYKKVFLSSKNISFTALLDSEMNYKINKKGNFIISSPKSIWTLYVDYRQTENEIIQHLNLCLEKIINQFLKERKRLEIFIKPIHLGKWTGKLCVIENSTQYYLLHNSKYCLILGMEHPASVKNDDVIHFINSINNIEPNITSLNNINVVRFCKFDFLWEFRLDNNCRFELNGDFIYLWSDKNNKTYARIIPVQQLHGFLKKGLVNNLLRRTPYRPFGNLGKILGRDAKLARIELHLVLTHQILMEQVHKVPE